MMTEADHKFRWRDNELDNALLNELASDEPDEHRVRELVAAGADVNSLDDSGDSVLIRAISFLQDGLSEKFVHLLIDLGADVNHETEDGWSALAETCLIGSPSVVEYLLAKGAIPTSSSRPAKVSSTL